jgi:hypothetical protein
MTFKYKGKTHHLLTLNDGLYVSYENILKNSKKLDPWNQFIIKKFSKDGEPLTDYISGCDKKIFRHPKIIETTKKFNPEFLI